MKFLKQSTVAYIPLGPVVDADDGFTSETLLGHGDEDVLLSKNGGPLKRKVDTFDPSILEAGGSNIPYYQIKLGTSDTDTLGRLSIQLVGTI